MNTFKRKTLALYDYLVSLLSVIGGFTAVILCFTNDWYTWIARIYVGLLILTYFINQDELEVRDYYKMGAMERFEYIMKKGRQ